MSRSKNYGTFTQWNFTQQRERKSLYPLQQHGWNWRLYGIFDLLYYQDADIPEDYLKTLKLL